MDFKKNVLPNFVYCVDNLQLFIFNFSGIKPIIDLVDDDSLIDGFIKLVLYYHQF